MLTTRGKKASANFLPARAHDEQSGLLDNPLVAQSNLNLVKAATRFGKSTAMVHSSSEELDYVLRRAEADVAAGRCESDFAVFRKSVIQARTNRS